LWEKTDAYMLNRRSALPRDAARDVGMGCGETFLIRRNHRPAMQSANGYFRDENRERPKLTAGVDGRRSGR
jgi:hypothetical protein